MVIPLHNLTATQALKLLKDNTFTVETYASSLLDRIKENDSTIKAWAYLGKLLLLHFQTCWSCEDKY